MWTHDIVVWPGTNMCRNKARREDVAIGMPMATTDGEKEESALEPTRKSAILYTHLYSSTQSTAVCMKT